MKRGPQFLQQRAGKLQSRMGGFVPGSHASFRGLDLHADLKDMDWIELYVFGITGRRVSQQQLRMFHRLWTFTCYPDARLWNNRIAALAGSSRSTGNLAMSAALAASEAAIYGRGVDLRAMAFLVNTNAAVSAGGTIAGCVRAELDKYRSIAGFARPLTAKDERVEPTLALARELGLDRGPHLRLAHEIDDYLAKGRWRMQMNYAALAAALMADMDFTPEEYYLLAFPTFLAGMQPCYIEALENPAGALFPVPCTHVLYQGEPARAWREMREDVPGENG